MKKLFAIFFKLVQAGLLLLFMAALTPAAWFAWRASQPMERAEFNGLSYYQFIQWRKMAYQDSAARYKLTHPEERVPQNGCFGRDLILSIGVGWPSTGFYSLTGIFPGQLGHFINPNDVQLGFVPVEVNWKNFFPSWWESYENVIIYITTRGSPIVYCRIPPEAPTPEEFRIMQQANQIP